MSHRHVNVSDVGITARTVTRRDALRLLIGAAGAAGAAALAPAAALAKTASEAQDEADAAQDKADATAAELEDAEAAYEAAQKQLSAIAEEYQAAAAKLSETQGKIAVLNAQIAETQDAIDAKEAEIEDTEDQISETEKDIETKQQRLGKRMSAAYKSGKQSTLDLLLSSASFEELTSNIYYLDKITESEKELIEEVKGLKEDLETQKAALEGQKSDLETQKAALESQKADLVPLQAQQQEELADAQAKQAEATTLVSGLSDSVQSLMEQHDAELVAAQEAAEEAKRIAEEAKKAKKSWATTTNTAVLGNGSLAAVTSAAKTTASPGGGLCAAWITYVFSNAGVGSFGGNACDMCSWWCGYDVSQIQPGMIIAVESSSSGTTAGRIYGHIGVYLGDGLVHHNVGYIKTDTVDNWVSTYCKYMDARCGWLGGIELS